VDQRQTTLQNLASTLIFQLHRIEWVRRCFDRRGLGWLQASRRRTIADFHKQQRQPDGASAKMPAALDDPRAEASAATSPRVTAPWPPSKAAWMPSPPNLITQVNTVYNASTGGIFSPALTPRTLRSIRRGGQRFEYAVSNDVSLASNLANLATTPISSLKNQTLQASYDSTVSGLGDSIDIATGQLNSNQTVAQC